MAMAARLFQIGEIAGKQPSRRLASIFETDFRVEGVSVDARRLYPRQTPRSAPAAGLELCIPLASSITLEPPRYSRQCRSTQDLACPQVRQYSGPGRRTGFLFSLCSLPNTFQREFNSWLGRAFCLQHL